MNEVARYAAELRTLADGLEQRADAAVRKTGLDVEADAKIFAPVDTGNLRNSICAVEVEGATCRLTKDATVISYAEAADAILVTSRAKADSAPSDQVMTVFEKGQYTLEKTHVWDTLGMRGTRIPCTGVARDGRYTIDAPA